VDQRFRKLQLPTLSRTILPLRKNSLMVSDEIVFSPLFSTRIKDYRFAGVQSPIPEHPMIHSLRRDTGLTGQTVYSDPSAKIWNLYLSQAEKFDKDHSESWTANTDGVLVFVRQTCLIRPSSIILTTQPSLRLVFFLPSWLGSSSSAIRSCSPIQPISPINCSPKFPNNCPHSRMGHPPRYP
jgi:hypothetical protein